jgi:hypothetical protein
MEDERIIEQFKSIASGTRSEGRSVLEIDVPEYVRVEFGDLLANIETRIWDRLGFGWEKGFERLTKFVETERHSRVPVSFVDEAGFRLGVWVFSRRQDYRKGRLSSFKVSALEKLAGWSWQPRETDFDRGLERLMAYLAVNGNTSPPDGVIDETGYPVGRWVNSRRQDYKSCRLSPEKVLILENLPGWQWNPGVTHFQKGFACLLEFTSKEGHSRVSANHCDQSGFKLGMWVQNRRQDYKKGKLTKEQVDLLESLAGWTWDPFVTRFDIGLERLKEFVAREGHSRVPKSYTDETGYPLGVWVDARRQFFKRGKLSPENIVALESLPGWVWTVYKKTNEAG